MFPFHEKILLSDPIVEYRRLIGSSVHVVRVITGDDPLLSSVMETLTPKPKCEPFYLSLKEVIAYFEDAQMRISENRKLSIKGA